LFLVMEGDLWLLRCDARSRLRPHSCTVPMKAGYQVFDCTREYVVRRHGLLFWVVPWREEKDFATLQVRFRAVNVCCMSCSREFSALGTGGGIRLLVHSNTMTVRWDDSSSLLTCEDFMSSLNSLCFHLYVINKLLAPMSFDISRYEWLHKGIGILLMLMRYGVTLNHLSMLTSLTILFQAIFSMASLSSASKS